MLNIYIRSILANDVNFILNSFLKSFKKSNLAKDVNNQTYYNFLQAKIKQKFKTHQILVACSYDDPNQIFGYVIFCELENKAIAIDYIYVKEIFREMKIANALIDKLNTENKIVYNTVLAESSRSKHIAKKLKSIYNPFLF